MMDSLVMDPTAVFMLAMDTINYADNRMHCAQRRASKVGLNWYANAGRSQYKRQ